MVKVNASIDPTEKISKRTLWTYSAGGIGRDMAYTVYSPFLLTFLLYT
jgi:hypothetical protein